jgi:hypothetical protein
VVGPLPHDMAWNELRILQIGLSLNAGVPEMGLKWAQMVSLCFSLDVWQGVRCDTRA